MESKESALRINMMQKKILNVEAKLGHLENAAKTRSFATVGDIWEEIKNYTPSSISNDPAAMGQPAAALQQKPRTSLVGVNHDLQSEDQPNQHHLFAHRSPRTWFALPRFMLSEEDQDNPLPINLAPTAVPFIILPDILDQCPIP